MIINAPQHAMPGWSAFYVSLPDRWLPAFLIHVDNKELAERLLRGERIEQIVKEQP